MTDPCDSGLSQSSLHLVLKFVNLAVEITKIMWRFQSDFKLLPSKRAGNKEDVLKHINKLREDQKTGILEQVYSTCSSL